MSLGPLRPEEASVYLVGFMGSGKSATGRLLAGRLRYDFEDTDSRVEEAEGRSIDRIFRESGEGRFREAEWRVLEAVAGRPRVVVATGGGAFLGVAHRALLRRHGVTVWLDAPLEVVRERIGSDVGRPLFLPSDPIALRAFFEKRRAAYALAQVRVEVGREGPDRVAARVLARLRELFPLIFPCER